MKTGYVNSPRVTRGDMGHEAPGHLVFRYDVDSQTFEVRVIQHMQGKSPRPTLARITLDRVAAVQFATDLCVACGE